MATGLLTVYSSLLVPYSVVHEVSKSDRIHECYEAVVVESFVPADGSDKLRAGSLSMTLPKEVAS